MGRRIKIIWSIIAKNSFNEIHYYYSKKVSKKVAKNIKVNIYNSISLLESQPFIGQKEIDFSSPNKIIYSIISGNYKIFYSFELDIIEIALIFDTRQDFIKLKKLLNNLIQ